MPRLWLAPPSTKNARRVSADIRRCGRRARGKGLVLSGMKLHVGTTKQGLGAQSGPRAPANEADITRMDELPARSGVGALRRPGLLEPGSSFAVQARRHPLISGQPASERKPSSERNAKRAHQPQPFAPNVLEANTPFHIVQGGCGGFAKVRLYRGLYKNTVRALRDVRIGPTCTWSGGRLDASAGVVRPECAKAGGPK